MPVTTITGKLLRPAPADGVVENGIRYIPTATRVSPLRFR
jgi:hypothetical protein